MLVLLAAAALAGPFDGYVPQAEGAWVSLSPDGERLAWVDRAEPHLLRVAPAVDEAAARTVATARPGETLGAPSWVSADQLAVPAVDGDDTRWFVYELDDGGRWPLGEGTPEGPLGGALLVTRDHGRGSALVRVDLATRERTPLITARGAVDAWVVDGDGAPVAALDRTWRTIRAEDERDHRLLARWRLRALPGGDVIRDGGRSFGYPNDGRWWIARRRAVDGQVVVVDGRPDRDTDAVVQLDLARGTEAVLFESPGPDVLDVLVSPDGRALAVAIEGARVRWLPLAPEIAPDLRRLDALDLDYVVVSHPESPRWLLTAWSATIPAHQLVYDRATGEVWRVGPRYGDFEARPWRPKEPLELRARDGLPLTAYLTTPEGDAPHPVVVLVHGGPWPARDTWRFDPMAQRLAAQGYAVLQVNFRGSDGLGNAFQEAWRGEWGGAMQTDLFDALDHVVAAGRVDPDHVAFVGASYGGYAVLAAVTQEPHRARCGVAMSGPALLRPRTLRLRDHFFYRAIDDRRQRRARSPALHVEALEAPVLLLHGGRDRTVSPRNALPFAEAAHALGKDVTFVLFPDDGHGANPDTVAAWLALTDAFLADCLGGAPPDLAEALRGVEFEVPYGDRVPQP